MALWIVFPGTGDDVNGRYDMAATLTNIRTGRHEGFDRIVLDLTDGAAILQHTYVDELLADGSGQPVELAGNVYLQVSVQAAAHDENGQSTHPGPPTFDTPALTNVRALAITGDFEGVLTVGIGVDHRSLHTVSTLTGPHRVVIDIGH